MQKNTSAWFNGAALVAIVLVVAFIAAPMPMATSAVGGLDCDTPGLSPGTACTGTDNCLATYTECKASMPGSNDQYCNPNSGTVACRPPVCNARKNDTAPNTCTDT